MDIHTDPIDPSAYKDAMSQIGQAVMPMPLIPPTDAPPLAPDGRAADAATPLLIDLDHALIRTDLLMESALAYLAPNPFRLVHLAFWMVRGVAHLKQKLAEAVSLDPELIPVNEKVVELALEAKRDGRPVYLVTAGDEEFARDVAKRVQCFDGVVSDDGDKDLTGPQRAALVSERFSGAYDYVGHSAADLHVWRNAREIVAVAPDTSTRREFQALDKPTTVIEGKSRLRALVKAARLHQWVKNTLIFVPAVLSGTITDPATAIRCAFAFLALGLIAVGTYLVNDLLDIDHDRRHWSKRFRPIAAGDLPIGTAIAAAAVSIAAGLAIGAVVGLGVLASLTTYLVLTLAYSIHLKRLPIIDVTVLATLFTLRIAIGIAAAGVLASPWLLVFSMALFASLSIAKRYTEIQRAATKGSADVPGRGYITADAPLVLGLGLATGTASVVILVLFLIFDALERNIYGNPHWLWLFPVIIFLWLGRIWLICQRGELNDDPVIFAIRDRQSLILAALSAAAFGLALFGTPL
jgi:4-hydroxybenzoate polyprenyltransferase/phosphoserine phosphatase